MSKHHNREKIKNRINTTPGSPGFAFSANSEDWTAAGLEGCCNIPVGQT